MSKHGGKDKDDGASSSSGDKAERPHHQGSVVAEDDDFTIWLNRLWARKEPPERFELWQVFGPNKSVRGEMVFHEDFKANEKLDIEQVTRLANELLEAAQNDADAARRPRDFHLVVIDRNRKASPLVRPVGPIEPKRTYVSDLDEEENLYPDARATNLAMIRDGLEETRWNKIRNDKVTGELLLLQHETIKEQRQVIRDQFNQLLTMSHQMQEAQDRSLDREVVREKEKFKISLWRDGMRTARNLLPSLFAGENGEQKQLGAGEGSSGTGGDGGGANGANGATKSYGRSPERTLVDNFLHDCEESKIDVALFGDFENREGKLHQKTPGIFSLKQFSILVGVRDGRLPPAALDPLMPQSGTDVTITAEQIKAAQEAGVTEGIGHAIVEIIGLRARANQQGGEPAQEE
jgi:hypothetical protein